MKKEKNEIKINHNSSNDAAQDGNHIMKEEEINNQDKRTEAAGSQNNVQQIEEELNKAKVKNEELDKEINDYKDKLLRKAAEFENYKRRTENDQLNLVKYAAESFIVKLLPVVDDLERSLQHIENAKDIEALKQGIKLVYDKFIRVLNEQGVKPIEALGKPFNVHFHDAMLQQKTNEAEPHTVINELEKGYMYKDRVIRHSKVIVSDAPDDEEIQPSGSNNESSKNSKDK